MVHIGIMSFILWGGGKEQISVEWCNWYQWLNVKEPADTEN